jgi:undecaprenyl-diphosphatase
MQWEFTWLYALQEIHNPVLDALMAFVSNLGNAGILWIVIGLLLCIPKKYRRCGIQMIVAMAVTFIIGNLAIKNLVSRDRPCWIDPTVPLLVTVPSDYSFPSGHSMIGFTAALTLFYHDKRLGIPALVLAALIAFSRLYNFVHFPTDVFVGIAIGTAVAIFVNYFMKAFWNRRDTNQLPE